MTGRKARTGRRGGPEILVVGYYGFGNLGDEAILETLVKDFGVTVPGARLVVASGDPEATRERHGVEAVGWQDIPALMDAVRSSDLVVVGGGGLFHDHWGVDPGSVLERHHYGISYVLSPLVAAHLTGTPSMVLGVGVGPLRTAEAERLTRAAFELAAVATVRDESSLELLEGLGVSRGRVRMGADPVFRLPGPAAEARREILRMAGIPEPDGNPVVGAVLRAWDVGVDGERWLEAVASALDRFASATGARLVLVPFQERDADLENDRRVSERLVGLLRDPGPRNFFALSRRFAKESGLTGRTALRALKYLEGRGMASVSMIGNCIFSIGDVRSLRRALGRFGEVLVCAVDNKGARPV